MSAHNSCFRTESFAQDILIGFDFAPLVYENEDTGKLEVDLSLSKCCYCAFALNYNIRRTNSRLYCLFGQLMM